MKKNIFSVMAVAMIFAFATPAHAQFKFGIKAGLNVTNMSFKSDVIKTDNRAGFFAGATAEFTVPLIGLGFDAAVQYEQRNVTDVDFNESATQEEDMVSTSTKHLDYIAIPINVKYNLGLGSVASVYAATGPQFSFNIGGKSLWNNSYELKKSEFSWNVGAGVKLLGHLQVGYNYNIALGNTAEVNTANIASEVSDAFKKIIGGNGKTNTHQIHLTYWF